MPTHTLTIFKIHSVIQNFDHINLFNVSQDVWITKVIILDTFADFSLKGPSGELFTSTDEQLFS